MALAAVVLAVLAVVVGPLAIALREPGGSDALPRDVPGRMIDVAGHRVHVVEQGEGSPVLLVHGFGASTFDFEDHALAALARSHRAVAVDLYGFGWSDRGDDFAYGWTLWSDQLVGVLDALGLARVSIVGHSMGGAVAAVFAARHPDRVDRLVLVDALYPQEEGEIPLVFKALRMPVVGELALGLTADPSPPGSSDAYRARSRAFAAIPGTRGAWLRYVRDRGKRAELGAAYATITSPTLVLHGTADASVSFETMQRAAPAIRGVRIVPLPNGSHFPLRDTPDAVVREVEAFLTPEPPRPVR